MASIELRAGSRDDAKVLNRSTMTRRLVARLHRDEAVIGGIGNTNFDLWASGQRPENFYMLGSMGLAIPIGMGVALAQPQRKVIALEGDGSLLMQLGALGTVATVAPRNLVIVVWDNGVYQITGSQKTLTSTGTDLVAVARATGLRQSAWIRDEAHFDSVLDQALAGDGPWFLAVRIDGEKPAGTTERDPAKIRQRFMQGLGVAH